MKDHNSAMHINMELPRPPPNSQSYETGARCCVMHYSLPHCSLSWRSV